MEPLGGRLVGDRFYQRLLLRLATPQAVETDLPHAEIDLGADEAMGPQGIDEVTPPQQLGLALLVGATQENHRPLQRTLQIQFPVAGEGCSQGSTIASWGRTLKHGGDEAIGMASEGNEIVVLETLPNFGLPAAVVILDGGLEARLSWRREDRHHAQLKAQTHDAAERVGPLMGTLEDGVVVKLSVAGQAVLAPIGNQCDHRSFRGPRRAEPTAAQAAVQAHGIEHHDIDAATNDQTFHEIEAVQLGLGVGHLGQIPALGRWRPPDPPLAIKYATTPENASDGAKRRHGFDSAFVEFAPEGSRPVFAQGAGLLELLSEADDEVFDVSSGCRSRAAASTRSIGPIDTVQAFAVGTCDPDLDGAEADMELSRHGTQRLALSDGGDQSPA
jgi:hypothetical protein